jgi:putative transposase
MRYPRLKPEETDSYMHVYNRVAGAAGEYPFGPAEKEEFIRRIKRLNLFYVVDVLAFQCMGNHVHLLLHIPAEPPSPEETARRYQLYYGGKRTLDPASEDCRRLALKLRDVSEYMKDLEQPFTRWFNRTRPVRRRGHLWADRFKNTLLENGLAVWDCWKYIEMNPVRAHLVKNPADYRFCSFGRWSAGGPHPFEEAARRHLLPMLTDLLQVHSLAEVKRELQKEFARITATEAQQSPGQIDTAIAVAAEKEPFTTRLDRRVRYWVDGLVIGSELFVRNALVQTRGRVKVAKRRLVRARSPQRQPEPLFCFRQLRILLE